MREEQFEKLYGQNRMIIKLLAAIAINGKTFREQISLLSDVGLQKIVVEFITGAVKGYVEHVLADDFSEGGFEANAEQDRNIEKVYLKMYKD